MGLHDDSNRDMFALTWADAELFGETITYTRYGAGVQSLNAVVLRLEPESTTPRTPGAVYEIFVANSSDTTIGIPAVNRGGDTVQITGVSGDLTVDEIIDQEGGAWHLRLR